MENLVISAKKKITLDKFVSSAKVSTSSDIKSVLNISAKSIINGLEKANNVVSLSGKVVVNVIYLNQENQVLSADAVVDFIEKQQVIANLSDMFAKDEVEVKLDTFSSSEILCSVTHNTQIFGIYKYEIADFVGENTSFVLNKKSFNSLKLVTACEDNFVVAEEVESNILNMHVLSSNAKVLSVEASSAADKIVINGKILAETIYTDGEVVQEILKEFEFKQEIEASAVLPNMIVDTNVEVKNITVTPEDKENKTNIVYAIDVFAKGYIYEDYTYEIATDMFSLDSEIQNTYDYLEFKNYSSQKESTDVVMSSTNVSEIENFDDIVGVYMPKISILNVNQENDKICADGIIRAFALYKTGEDILRLEVESPLKLEFLCENGEVFEDIYAVAEISSFKVKAGKELEVAFRVNACMTFGKVLSESFIRSFEIKDSKPTNEGGIKVYVTKEGETLFDVAKVLSVRPEMILEQNEVDDVFEQGEKIYVYSPINCM